MDDATCAVQKPPRECCSIINFKATIVLVFIVAIFCFAIGTALGFIGIVSCVRGEVWRDHKVSPIVSGAFFIITGIVGICSLKYQTSYMVLCFTASSIVTLITALISIQLLRLGLFNHTSDGHTYLNARLDSSMVTGLGIAIGGAVLCVISLAVSCRLATLVRLKLMQKREGLFHVIIHGDKDVVIVTKKRGGGGGVGGGGSSGATGNTSASQQSGGKRKSNASNNPIAAAVLDSEFAEHSRSAASRLMRWTRDVKASLFHHTRHGRDGRAEDDEEVATNTNANVIANDAGWKSLRRIGDRWGQERTVAMTVELRRNERLKDNEMALEKMMLQGGGNCFGGGRNDCSNDIVKQQLLQETKNDVKNDNYDDNDENDTGGACVIENVQLLEPNNVGSPAAPQKTFTLTEI